MNDDLADTYEIDQAVEQYVGGLTRRSVEEKLRSSLQAGGYAWLQFGSEQLAPGLLAALESGAVERVRVLFPEFDS